MVYNKYLEFTVSSKAIDTNEKYFSQVTTIDRQVAKLYEEGARKPRSSDSSRRTRFSNRRSTAGAGSIMSVRIVFRTINFIEKDSTSPRNIFHNFIFYSRRLVICCQHLSSQYKFSIQYSKNV